MKKVNFEFLELKSLSGKVEVANLKEFIADQIYSMCSGLKYKLLAEKIYKSPSPCELDDEEVKSLLKLSNIESGVFSNKVADALRELVEKEG